MVRSTSANRQVIIEYLELVSEDDLINYVIIPFYNWCGYATKRIMEHGPGEHGKDIIFSKYSPALYDIEYLVVQAKAQKVIASNVAQFSDQLKRASRVPISGLAGGGEIKPNYVIFFNSKGISNDSYDEFPHLVDENVNIKIISQENVCDLMFSASIIPSALKTKLDVLDENNSQFNEIDRTIKEILYNDRPAEIKKLFNNILPLEQKNISIETKKTIIDYIFKTWEEDQSWAGTVNPMSWLNRYFDYLHIDQVGYLKKVLDEYFSTTPSFDARKDTTSIIQKITDDQFLQIEDEFINYVAELIIKMKPDHNFVETYFDRIKWLPPIGKGKLVKRKLLSQYYELYKNTLELDRIEKLEELRRKIRLEIWNQ